MNFDLLSLPTTLDMAHGGLALSTLVMVALYLLKGGRETVEVIKEVEKPVEVIKEVEVVKEVEKPVEVIREVEVIKEIVKEVMVESPALHENTPEAALQLLSLLQQEARFVDFLQEDIGGYADAEIGAAARVIHAGGHKVLNDYFTLTSVRDEAEESRITLPVGFDAGQVRLTGHVVGEAPFTGTLIHRGWKVADVNLPTLADGHDARIIAAAEVEL